MGVVVEMSTPESCIACGTLFSMMSALRAALLVNGKTFHCPNGHPQSYVIGPSAVDQERALRIAAERRASDAQRDLETERRNNRAALKRAQKKAGEPIVRLLPRKAGK